MSPGHRTPSRDFVSDFFTAHRIYYLYGLLSVTSYLNQLLMLFITLEGKGSNEILKFTVCCVMSVGMLM